MLYIFMGRGFSLERGSTLEQERDFVESLPPGVKVLARYIVSGEKGGFIHILRAESEELLKPLISAMTGVQGCELIPVSEIPGTCAIFCEDEIPMHGPI